MMVGTTLNHYRIVRSLGSGGMGEVYAAEDTKLHRLVALKILPAATADDTDRLERFQREAQAIAALNHPNVVTIYSVEVAYGRHFLTMEIVEGKTLAELIPVRGLPLAEILKLAIPLADAVSAAHAQGVVHRDLKPSNVMVGLSGRLKVLDFGLAKLRQEALGVGQSSIITDRLTAPHQIFGTPAYMSPEQIEGRPVDHRTDLFAIGILLYEMAAGTRPFRGDTSFAVMSSILKDTPAPLTERRPDLPSDVDRIVRRCLAKDPARRVQTALDLRNELEDLHQQITSGPPVPPVATVPRAQTVNRVWLAAAVAAVMVAISGFAIYRWTSSESNDRSSSIAHPVFTQLTSQPAAELFPSLSPDAKWVVYAGEGAGNRDIYLQSTTGQTPINLTKDSPADDEQPAFSPDGEYIAFRSERDGGGIFVMGRTGDAVRRVTRNGFNPAWSPDGKQIAYATGRMELRPQNSDGRSELWVVSAGGGEPRKLYDGDATLPNWSPGAKRIAFSQRGGTVRRITIASIAVAGGTPSVVDTGTIDIDWNPVWSPDGRFLYYSSDRAGSMNLWRVPVDEQSGAARGAPQPITTPAPFAAHISIAAGGTRLAYSAVAETQNIQRLRFDPDKGEPVGEPMNVTTGSRKWSSPDPSPDGEWVVFYSQIQPEGDLYVIKADGTGAGFRQLTNDEAIDRVPRWSPDGDWIVTFSNRGERDHLQVWKIHRDGSGLQPVTTDLREASVSAWSPDGSRLAIAGSEDLTTNEKWQSIVILDPHRPFDAQTPQRVLSPLPTKLFVPNSWSPDGGAIAGQNGFVNMGVAIYWIASGKHERLTEFGEWPVWLPDSQRILFVARGREFHVLDTRTRQTRMVVSVNRDTLGPPRLTRDGRAAFFSRRVTEADVWLVNLQ